MQWLDEFAPFSGTVAIKGKWKSQAQKVISLEAKYKAVDSEQLRKHSLALRYEVLSGCLTEQILVEAFALVRESTHRHLKIRHYPVQLIGGAAMVDGCIAVMPTGEGKTLAATLPLYLAALAGKGAHLATANDYLAVRDAKQMQPVFAALGLTTGMVEQSTERPARQKAYACDITYSTAKEIGFDFLRDRLQMRCLEESGLTHSPFGNTDESTDSRPVQRGLHFMLVDEADSILIDEARTPLVISSLPDDLDERRVLYEWSARSTGSLQPEKHFEFDENTKSITLTAAGRTDLRKLPKPELLSKTPLTDIYEQIELALLVEEKFLPNRHYVIRDGEVVIVDEFTGRLAEGRKWRAGLHQAIEARESLMVTAETAEAARITIQDLFLKYRHLCGMTGTVASSASELNSIYKTPVAHIPTNKPPRRTRMTDQVFGNDESKWQAIVEAVAQLHRLGRPVLVGTRSIDKSILLSKLLTTAGIEHEVLNARQLTREADIVAQAGQYAQVTVATNMAGRGTDIRLSETALTAGGLHVIITEMHESERIDRQLTGRCGRQGDPGSYQFFMALQDDILLTGLGPKMAEKMKAMGRRNDQPSTQLARMFRRAQAKIEASHFRGRKMLLAQERNRQTSQKEMGQDPYVDTIS